MSSGQARLGRRFGVALISLLAAALFVCAPATAHSSWPSYYSAKSALSMDGEGLHAVVVVEVPTFEMVTGFREYFRDIDLMAEIEANRFQPLEEEYSEAQFERFASGLVLTVDGGEAVGHWRPVDSPVNGKGTEGFFVYMLEFVFAAPADLGACTEVRLENNLLLDQNLVLANVAQAEGGWEVVDSSIPPPEEYPGLPQGVALAEGLGLWTEDPIKRDLRVAFARTGE